MAYGYSYSHIKKQMKDIYNLNLIDVNENVYKAYRYDHIHIYNLLDEESNIVLENVTLQALATLLKKNGDY